MSVSISAVGDLMFGDSPQVFGWGVASAVRTHGPDFPLASVRQRLAAADLTIGNLEVPLAADPAHGAAFDQRIYRGAPAMAGALARAGFDIVSVCTNHMMQHGQSSLHDTLSHLRAAGVTPIGADSGHHGAGLDAVVVRGGMRVGCVAFNFRPPQYFLAPPAWPTPDLPLIRAAVEDLRARADLVVVCLHWGDEFMLCPSPAQVGLAHAIVDAGAHVILGHHTHTLQGVERYRDAVIAYSLGNFVYDQWQERLRRSCILELEVEGPGRIRVHREPVLIGADHQPEFLEGAVREAGLNEFEMLDRQVGSLTDEEYARQLRRAFRRFRGDIYLHYLRHAWRFERSALVANLFGAVRRRLGGAGRQEPHRG